MAILWELTVSDFQKMLGILSQILVKIFQDLTSLELSTNVVEHTVR